MNPAPYTPPPSLFLHLSLSPTHSCSLSQHVARVYPAACRCQGQVFGDVERPTTHPLPPNLERPAIYGVGVGE